MNKEEIEKIVLDLIKRLGQRNLLPSGVAGRNVKSFSAEKIEAGTIKVALSLGVANILIDGENKRIIINDGTTDRILIGFQSGGF